MVESTSPGPVVLQPPSGGVRALAARWRAWRTRWLTPAVGVVLFAVLFAALMVARKPSAFFQPQLWAEDGPLFLLQAEAHGMDAWGIPYAGYLHLLPRLIASLWSGLDVAYLPAAYGWSAAAVWWAVGLAFLSRRLTWPRAPWLALGLLAVPHTGEVYFQLLNVQWATAVVLLMQLGKRPAETPGEWARDGLLLGVTALTGPFAVVLAPLYGWRVWGHWRRPAVWMELAIIVGAAVTHFVVGRGTPGAAATMAVDPGPMLAFVGARLFGVTWGGWEWAAAASAQACIALAVAGLAGLGALAWWPRERRPQRVMVVVGVLALLAATLLRGGPELWTQPAPEMGDRYLYLPRLVLVWVLVWQAGWSGWVGRGCLAALIIMMAVHGRDYRLPTPTDHRWADYVPALRAGEAVRIPTLPDGWHFESPARPPR